MDTAADGPNGRFSGLHKKKSKIRLKLWSDSQSQAAVILKKHSAKHLSVCSSRGCQQLTDARWVMKLLIQPTGSSPLMFFQKSPDFSGFSGQLQGAYSGARSCRKQILASQYLLPKNENQEDRGLDRACKKPRVLDARLCTSRSFIVMTHTIQHQVPPPSRTVPCELSALNLAAGLEDLEYLIHAEQPAFLWSMDWLKRRTSRVEINTCKCSEIRRLPVPVQLLDANKPPTPGNHRCNNLGNPNMNGPLPVSGQNLCSPLWIWQLELGMLSIWRTASCCTTGWSINWLKWPTSGFKINKRKCSEITRRCTHVGRETNFRNQETIDTTWMMDSQTRIKTWA